MPCQCLPISHHYGCIKYCVFYANKEKLKISLYNPRKPLTSQLIASEIILLQELVSSRLTTIKQCGAWVARRWELGAVPMMWAFQMWAPRDGVLSLQDSQKGEAARSVTLSLACNIRLKANLCRRAEREIYWRNILKQYCEKTMELSQNGISRSQQTPAGNNGLANTAKRKQEYKILSHRSPTFNLLNLSLAGFS